MASALLHGLAPRRLRRLAAASALAFIAATPAPAQLAIPSPTPNPTPTPAPLFINNAPVEVLWAKYYASVDAVKRGDLRGAHQFEACLANEDTKWLRASAPIIARLVAPGTPLTSLEQAEVIAIQAMLPNMPQAPMRDEQPTIRLGTGASRALGVARVPESGPAGRVTFTTVITQENGTWVLVQPFFVRTFVWLPQLAAAKRLMGLPLDRDETLYSTNGFAPFQEQVKAVFAGVGYQAQ